jgi:hypothetical protein
MATRLDSVVIDAANPGDLAAFWAAAIGGTARPDGPEEYIVSTPGAVRWGDGGAPDLIFGWIDEPKEVKNRVHLDLTSTSAEDQQAKVDRLLSLGARSIDVGQRGVQWRVLADPEGNELCVLEPRAEYADRGPIAAVAMDAADPAGLARFWAEATGWVITQSLPGGATLRHPSGAGVALELVLNADEKRAKNRVHLDVAPGPSDDHEAEVERLIAAGAKHANIGQGAVKWVVLADPEGNELCVLTPR